eukprot:Rmarinus@m.26174
MVGFARVGFCLLFFIGSIYAAPSALEQCENSYLGDWYGFEMMCKNAVREAPSNIATMLTKSVNISQDVTDEAKEVPLRLAQFGRHYYPYNQAILSYLSGALFNLRPTSPASIRAALDNAYQSRPSKINSEAHIDQLRRNEESLKISSEYMRKSKTQSAYEAQAIVWARSCARGGVVRVGAIDLCEELAQWFPHPVPQLVFSKVICDAKPDEPACSSGYRRLRMDSPVRRRFFEETVRIATDASNDSRFVGMLSGSTLPLWPTLLEAAIDGFGSSDREVGARSVGFSDLKMREDIITNTTIVRTAIPGLEHQYRLHVWDGDHCPISRSILSSRTWEASMTQQLLLLIRILQRHAKEHWSGHLEDMPAVRFIDVGANIGYYTLMAASTGCDVQAVEPVRLNHDLLLSSAELNPWLADRLTVYKAAVGAPETLGESVCLASLGNVNAASSYAVRESERDNVFADAPCLDSVSLTTIDLLLRGAQPKPFRLPFLHALSAMDLPVVHEADPFATPTPKLYTNQFVPRGRQEASGSFSDRFDALEEDRVNGGRFSWGTQDAPTMVKMDIEGYETFALRGMTQTLKGSRPCFLLLEYGRFHMQRTGVDFDEQFRILLGQGYRAFLLEEFTWLSEDPVQARLQAEVPARADEAIAVNVLFVYRDFGEGVCMGVYDTAVGYFGTEEAGDPSEVEG